MALNKDGLEIGVPVSYETMIKTNQERKAKPVKKTKPKPKPVKINNPISKQEEPKEAE